MTGAEPSAARRGSARTRLLEAAAGLFYAEGIAATGIDKVIAEAGVAKRSLYNNFSSKEELVLAYLECRHQEWMELYRHRAQGADRPEDGVLAVFDAYLDHAEAAYVHAFRGCGLLNAAAELPAGARGREAVRRHKDEVEQILGSHLERLAPRPLAQETAEQLSFLLEGAMSRAGLDGSPDRLRRARRMAERILAGLGREP
ncbi:TetR/AcrR family transcriptional regulator [Nesterenkonia sp. K-15-9-6]|uniref:TetR/AcrR family transcriptional regulator n=1 Tax=Nesterenkonia sp. K-15-9-6 TaxID=3093918 RepID=UPI004043FCFF